MHGATIKKIAVLWSLLTLLCPASDHISGALIQQSG